MNEDEEGFQSEPEIILIHNEPNEKSETENDENDENEQPTNENDETEADDEVKMFIFKQLIFPHFRLQDAQFA